MLLTKAITYDDCQFLKRDTWVNTVFFTRRRQHSLRHLSSKRSSSCVMVLVGIVKNIFIICLAFVHSQRSRYIHRLSLTCLASLLQSYLKQDIGVDISWLSVQALEIGKKNPMRLHKLFLPHFASTVRMSVCNNWECMTRSCFLCRITIHCRYLVMRSIYRYDIR